MDTRVKVWLGLVSCAAAIALVVITAVLLYTFCGRDVSLSMGFRAFCGRGVSVDHPGWIVFSDPLLKKMNLATGRVETITPDSEWILAYEPAISPDGKRIAFAGLRKGDSRMAIWVTDRFGSNFISPTRGQTLDGQEFSSRHPAWSPGGDQILFLCTHEGEARRWPDRNALCSVGLDWNGVSEVREEFGTLGGDGAHLDSLTWGRGRLGPTLEVWFLPDQRMLIWEASFWGPVMLDGRYPSWSPDRDLLAFVSSDGEICIHDPTTHRSVCLADAPSGISPSWSPDGEWLVFSSLGGGPGYNIFVMRADGSSVRCVTGWPGDEFDPLWLPE